MADERFAWWSSLKHGGMLVAPSRLEEYFEEQPPSLPPYLADRLRRDLTRLDSGSADGKTQFVTTVLEDVCGLKSQNGARWTRGNDVDPIWSHRAPSGEVVKPRRLWQGPNGGLLPVFVDDEKRLGIGRGRRSASRVIQWLRAADQKLAILTNGRQFRLIYAGLDFDAWAEWDTELWFEEGRPGPQVDALRALLSPHSLTPPQDGEPSPLLAAVLDSRKGEAELSSVLGERVREAVELLIQAYAPSLERIKHDIRPEDIYRAATRVVMRMVVALFAEARDLLPRANPVYYNSYSLDGLREELSRYHGAGLERLRDRRGAWPRILALFRLIYHGSPHSQLTVHRYGGGLFRPGDPDASDPVRRAVAAFEAIDLCPSDLDVQRILQLLCRTKVKVRQGRAATWVDAPVDFSDLSSEYIGVLYEGLLDFELRQAHPDDPILFLELGDQPALPLARLENMSDAELDNLVKKFKVKSQKAPEGDGDGDDEAEEEEDAEADEAEADDESDDTADDLAADEPASLDDQHHAIRERAVVWAKRAVAAGKLVPKPRGRLTADKLREFDEQVARMADRIVRKTVLPGEWYLVRWGGTRKGAGTFYTRPQLAVPTVLRTLLPLTHNPPVDAEGQSDTDAVPSEWTPKEPAEILKLKVCDPAMGSGSFLVAALRHLTDTLYSSLLFHGWLVEDKVGLKLGDVPNPIPPWLAECIKDFPLTTEDYEGYVRARLRRIVCERCLYGVDIDPLAVELGRLALWVETMDRNLPFEFLDHKLKCGNSLVGCWFDRFQDYPLMAWEREGGDKGHTRGVHFENEAWTKAIKAVRNGPVKTEMVEVISGQEVLPDLGGCRPEEVHHQAEEVYETLHAAEVVETDEKEDLYHAQFEENHDLKRVRQAFDCWCAVWFWPAEELAAAPTPRTFANPPEETRKVVERLRNDPRLRFFHWELEFPDVFRQAGDGFDAIVGNPPWETLQPNSKEFFSNVDPLYRAYGKQEALHKQKEYFEADAGVEHEWLEYCSYYKAFSNWFKSVAGPFGDGEAGTGTFSLVQGKRNEGLRTMWQKRRERREGYLCDGHPFRYQGSGKAYTYRMFLELGHFLLRDAGAMGFLVPSGVYTDHGTAALRRLLLNHCDWQWLFGFENRDGIFSIHRSFKFCPLIVHKGGQTQAIRTAFMHRNLDDWTEAERHVIPYGRQQVERFSPKSRAILEIRSRRDLEVLERIYDNSVLLGDDGPDGWGVKYAQGDFNMTSDSKLFPPREQWEAKGYRPDEYGRWIGPEGDVALPLYQGGMVHQMDPASARYAGGSGHAVSWEPIEWSAKRLEPQYLMAREHAEGGGVLPGRFRVAYRYIANPTNQRSMICSLVCPYPCGHSIGVLHTPSNDVGRMLSLTAVLNSYTFDCLLRTRFSGSGGVGALDPSKLAEHCAPSPTRTVQGALVGGALRLNCACILLADAAWAVNQRGPAINLPWKRLWAITPHERLRLRSMLDAIVAELYGLEWDDFAWILRDCDHPAEVIGEKAFARTLDPKGFWRVDKGQDPELRHTVLSLVALRDLKETIASHGGDRDAGLAAFCAQNEGDGWMLPEALCLADYGLGHDDRAKQPQPVRERLGERFLPWQLEQSVEESWAECERHARNILGEDGYRRLMAEINGNPTPGPQLNEDEGRRATSPRPADGNPAPDRPTDLFGNPLPTDLFGNVIYPEKKKRK